MAMTLSHILDSIRSPSSVQEAASEFYVLGIPGMPHHFFGRDSQGRPCLLLATRNGFPKAPLVLAGIEVRFSISCQVSVWGTVHKIDTLTTVLCKSMDPVIQRYFTYVCETIVAIVGRQPSLQQVIDGVYRLTSLFERLAQPSTRSIIGLFAELYVIHTSSSPSVAVEAWHSKVDDRFDFSIGDIRVEVKASSARQRVHSFGREQCMPPHGTRGILVSCFVETSGGGLSFLDLLESIERQLDDNTDLVLKLQETVADTLGTAITSALPMRFDEELARASIRVYELDSIPAVRDAVPPEVSQVHFRSDLSRCCSADVAGLVTEHQYARALLPKTLIRSAVGRERRSKVRSTLSDGGLKGVS